MVCKQQTLAHNYRLWLISVLSIWLLFQGGTLSWDRWTGGKTPAHMLTCKSAGVHPIKDAQKHEELHNHIFALKDIMCILQQKDVWLSRLSPVTHHTGCLGCCRNLEVTPHNLPSVLCDHRTQTPFTRQRFTRKRRMWVKKYQPLHREGLKTLQRHRELDEEWRHSFFFYRY